MSLKNDIYIKTLLYTVGKTKEARFLIDDWKKYVRVKILMKDLSDVKGKLKIAFNLPIGRNGLYFLINELKELNEREEGYSSEVNVYRPKWIDNKRTDEMELSGTIGVGRRKSKTGDIINYIIVKTPEGTPHVFKLLPTPYFRFIKNGKLCTDEENSKIWTKIYAKMLEDLAALFLDTVDEKETKPNESALAQASEPKVLVKTNTDDKAKGEENKNNNDILDELDDII